MENNTNAKISSISRQPGAITGIGLALLLGVFAFQGNGDLLGSSVDTQRQPETQLLAQAIGNPPPSPQQESAPTTSPTPVPTSQPVPRQTVHEGIPQNPRTVAMAQGTLVAAHTPGAPPTPRPISQPNTGAGLVLLLLFSSLVFIKFSRRMLS